MSQTNFHIHVTQWAKLLFSFCGVTAPSGPGPPHCLGFMITLKTHHTWCDSSGQVISPMQRPDNTALTRDIHVYPWQDFESAIPASEQQQTNASDCAVTGIGQAKL